MNRQITETEGQMTVLKHHHGISEDDIRGLPELAKVMEPAIQSVLDDWYEWLPTIVDTDQFFSSTEHLTRVKDFQNGYWQQFFHDDRDESFGETRRIIGATHARIGLPLTIYASGVSKFQALYGEVLANSKLPAAEKLKLYRMFIRLSNLDASIIVDRIKWGRIFITGCIFRRFVWVGFGITDWDGDGVLYRYWY